MFKKGHRPWNYGNLTIKCQTCGRTVHTVKARIGHKFCSRQCYWESLKGKPSPKKRVVSVVCQTCKKEFEAQLHENRKYCSYECYWKSLGGKTPRYKNGTLLQKQNRFRRICPICENEFYTTPSTHQRFCSHKCYWKSMDNGLTAKNYRIRRSAGYAKWRKKVFERDDYTCQICKKRGGELQADHIKSFAYFPKLRFDLNNGRTLCKKCHRKITTRPRPPR